MRMCVAIYTRPFLHYHANENVSLQGYIVPSDCTCISITQVTLLFCAHITLLCTSVTLYPPLHSSWHIAFVTLLEVLMNRWMEGRVESTQGDCKCNAGVRPSRFTYVTCRTRQAKLSVLAREAWCYDVPFMNGTVGS